MPNRNYEAGRRFEWKVRDHYEEMGYVVFRLAGSKGLFDLVAWPPTMDKPILIQCKTRGLPSLAERNAIEGFTVCRHAVATIARNERGKIRFNVFASVKDGWLPAFGRQPRESQIPVRKVRATQDVQDGQGRGGRAKGRKGSVRGRGTGRARGSAGNPIRRRIGATASSGDQGRGDRVVPDHECGSLPAGEQ